MTAPRISLSLERGFCLLLQGRKRLTVGALRTVTDLRRNIGDQAGEPGSRATEGEFCPGTLDRLSLRKSVSSGFPGVRNQLPMFCRPCSPEFTLEGLGSVPAQAQAGSPSPESLSNLFLFQGKQIRYPMFLYFYKRQ